MTWVCTEKACPKQVCKPGATKKEVRQIISVAFEHETLNYNFFRTATHALVAKTVRNRSAQKRNVQNRFVSPVTQRRRSVDNNRLTFVIKLKIIF